MIKKPTRDGYGEALLELIETNDKVIVMDADVAKSTRTNWVQEKNPEKFLDMGISEQDMVGTAAGMALAGMTPFVTTYGVFLSGRAWDQIRTTVCYTDLNVKFGGAHGGISVGPDGATHQALEEVTIMRVLPNMTVIVPCDAIETKKATLAAAEINGPVYLRFGREAVPIVTEESTPFEVGKGATFKEGKDITVIANGPMVYEALAAAELLAKEGIEVRVINLHTAKPLDEEIIIKAAKETGAIVTAEEHQIAGGMGSAVAECVVRNHPVPIEMVGVKDTFGESGEPKELAVKYELTSDSVVDAIRKVLKRK
ncbi:MAG: transketolase family protein [Clostridia bacterium]